MMLPERATSRTWLWAWLVVGLLTGWASGCALSPNPDLPGFPAGDGDGDSDGDTTGLDTGDGDGELPGAGGAPHVGGMGGGGAGGVGGLGQSEVEEGQ